MFALGLVNLAAQAATITLDESVPVNTSPMKIGVNVSTSTYYDSGQMFKNLLFTVNPGFEGFIQQEIVGCISGSTTTCTNYNQYDIAPLNYWAGATAYFCCSASPSNPNFGLTRTVSSSTTANGGVGPAYTFSSALPQAVATDDYFSVVRQVDSTGSGIPGWVLSGPATGVTGTSNIPPESAGLQALSLPSGGCATTYVDTTGSHDFIILQTGQTYQFNLKTIAVSGSPAVTISISRLGGGGGVIPSSMTLTPGSSWATQSAYFAGNEAAGPVYGDLQIQICNYGTGTATVDDADLERWSNLNASNTTVYRDEVVSSLAAINPGSLRLWDYQLGETLADWTNPLFGRHFQSSLQGQTYITLSTGRNAGATAQGLMDFLALCEFIGAKPWITIPLSWPESDYSNLIDFLAGGSNTTYGAKRIANGHAAPYTSILGNIYIEFGNEPWNSAFAGINMPNFSYATTSHGMLSYGQWSGAAMSAMKANSNYLPSALKFIVNMQAGSTYEYMNHILPNNPYLDAVSIAPYIGTGQLDSVGTLAAEWNPETAFTWGDTNDTAGESGNGWTYAYIHTSPKPVYIYEDNENQVNGTAPTTILQDHNSSFMAGTVVAQQMLEHLKAIGPNAPQQIWSLAQDQFSNSSRVQIPLYGIIKEAGGEWAGTGNFLQRPLALAAQIANNSIIGPEYSSTVTSADTYTTAASNGLAPESNVPYEFAYCFMKNSDRSCVLVNTDPSNSHTFRLTGTNLPTSVTKRVLSMASGTIDTCNNESATPCVSIVTTSGVPVSGGAITVPPGTIAGIDFTTGGSSTPPGITGVGASGITSASATITWMTDQSATSQVAYGTTPALGTFSVLNSSAVTAHSVTLGGLTPNTTYYYAALSSAGGQVSTSATFTFSTPVGVPVVAASGNTCTYNGSPCPGSGSATGAGGTLLAPVTLSYTGTGYGPTSVAPANAGTYTVIATFAGNSNYTSGTSAAAVVTINPATPAVVAFGNTCAYSGSPCAGTGSATGVGGGALSPVTLSYSGTGYGPTSVAPTNAGTYTVTATFSGNVNYTSGASAAATVLIGQAAPIVTATGNTCVYNGSPCAGTGSATGVGGGALSPVTLSYSGTGYGPTSTAPTNAGTYMVTATLPGNPNYTTVTSSAATVLISQATPTVTATGNTCVYNGSPCAGGGSATGVGGNALSPVTLSYSGAGYGPTSVAPTNAGSYTVIASFAGNTNYTTVISAAATVLISQATPTVVATGSTCVYNGSPCASSGSATGVGGIALSPVTLSYSGTGYGPTGTPPINAGSYKVIATFAASGNYTSGTSAAANVMINPATPTIVATGNTCTYNGSPCAGSGSATGVGGIALSPVTLSYSGTGYGPTSAPPTNAGTYTVVATFAASGNYATATSTAANITISPATPTVMATGNTCTYTGSPCAGSGSATGAGGIALSPVTLSYSGTGYGPTVAPPTNAGTYTVTASFAASGNYAAATSAPATVTVSPAVPTVVAAGNTCTYNGSPCAGTGSATGVGGSVLSPVTLSYSGTGYGPTGTPPTNVGTYTVTASFAASGNYGASTSAAAIVTISQATPTVVATGNTCTYNGSPCAGSGAATGAGGSVLSPVALSYSGSGYGPTSVAPTNVGSYTVIASFAGNSNYTSGTSAAATVLISRATPTVVATGNTCIYSGSPCAGSGSATGLGGIALTPVTLSYSGTGYGPTSTPPTNAGTYTVVAIFAASGNYVTGTSAAASVIISGATPTVVATGNTCTYSGSPCAGSGSATGAGGIALSPVTLSYSGTGYGPTAAPPTNAGTYTVTASFAASGNYAAATSAAANITINAAIPTVAVTGNTCTYNGSPCAGNGSATGVGGIALSPVTLSYSGTGYGPTGTPPTNAGTYTVTATFAASGNYATGTSAAASVTIGQATPTVVAAGSTCTYSGSPCAGSGAATGAGGSMLSPVTLSYSGTGYGPTNVAPTNVGSYMVIASFAGNSNYTPGTSAAATVTISQATATVVATGNTCTYNGSPCAGSGSATVAGIALSPVTLSYSGTGYGPTSTPPTNAGTYALIATFAGNGNYAAGTSTAASVIVNAAAPTVLATGNTCAYNGSPCAGSGSATGLGGTVLSPVTLSYSGTGYGPTSTPPTNAGTYTLIATVAASGNYAAGTSAAASVIINATVPTVMAIGNTCAYSGSPCAGSGSATGLGGVALSPVTLSYSGTGYGPTSTPPTNVGTYTTVATFAASGNYAAGTSAAANVTINAVVPAVVATGNTCTYNGSPCAGSGSATGAGGSVLSPVTLSYSGTGYGPTGTPPTNVGTYTVIATFAAGGNYATGTSAAANVTISQATPTVVAAGNTCTYSGSACAGSGSATGAGGIALSPVTLTYSGTGYGPTSTAPTNAGTYTVTATFGGNGNYKSLTSTAANVTIGQATPTVLATGNTCTYSGSPCAGSGAATGVGGSTLSPVTLSYSGTGYGPSATPPTNAGTYTVTASFAGNTNYKAGVSAAAALTINEPPAPAVCLYVLSPTATDALNIGGGATVTTSSCGVYVNSNAATALLVTGGTLKSNSVSIVGGYAKNQGGSISSTPKTGVAPIADPFASLPAPTVPHTCPAGNFANWQPTAYTPSAGCYNGFSVGNGMNAVLEAGTYIINGGTFSIQGGSTVTAKGGVMIYLTNGATAYIANGANVTLAAESSGAYQGVLFFQDRTMTSPGSSTFAGGAAMHLSGSLYLPHALMNLDNGNNTVAGSLVVSQVNFQGGATFTTQ
jgi:hypothetical protein